MIHSFKAGAVARAWPDYQIAEDLLERLSGFPRFPQAPKGRTVFVEALMKCVSEEHARAAVDVFDEEFPTLRGLRDAVFSTRAKFESSQPAKYCDCPAPPRHEVHCEYFIDPNEIAAMDREWHDYFVRLRDKVKISPNPIPRREFTQADFDRLREMQKEGRESAD